MDIIIIFDKIGIDSIAGKENSFKDGVCKAAFSLTKEVSGEKATVQLVEGKLPSSSEKSKMAIYISSSEMSSNLGQLIVDFKRSMIDLLGKYSISLSMQELDVKVNSSFNVNGFIKEIGRSNNMANKSSDNDEFDYEQKSKQYVPVDPLYSFERVILPTDMVSKIQEAVGILECENKVFKEWGLYEIQPHPSTALSFFGPSGTGKTMAAEAVAQKLGKKILKVSYADVESKYHGEGPKMVKAIFLAASNADAVLFFDEADSLLSKRLTSVTQGSEQAINSMRSQLLICLEEFRGIVIFATNLVINYDQAFLTRLISVEFKMPDSATRKTIWDVHIKAPDDGKEHQLNIPLSENVDTTALSERYEFVGREIRNAVVSACVSVVLDGRDVVTQEDFIAACEKILKEQKSLAEAKDHTKAPANDILKEVIKNKLKSKEEESGDVS